MYKVRGYITVENPQHKAGEEIRKMDITIGSPIDAV